VIVSSGGSRRRNGGSEPKPQRDGVQQVAQTDAVVDLPGGTIAYTTAGTGEPLLLIHGLGGTRRTWRLVIDSLAATHTVIAPDLPGHGESNAPAGDYSLGAHAAAMRDFVVALGYSSTTVAGHSLGGGIALQFAYQFPSHTRRLLLISSGGLGPELSVVLRAATLPGAAPVVAGLASLPEGVRRSVLETVIFPGLLARQDAGAASGLLRGLAGPRQRQAFLRTARSVVDWHGQTVGASRQLVLLTDIPVSIIWGSNDKTIPPDHHRAFARQLPSPDVVEIPDAGHYPHETAPTEVTSAMHAFLDSTTPFTYDEARWRELLTQTSSR